MKFRNLAVLAAPLALATGCSDAPETRLTAPEPLLSMVECELGVPLADAYDEITALRAEVDALEASGALNSGQAQALRNKLDSAREHLDAGRVCPALAQLEAFREQVGNFVADGVLTEAEAAPLLEGAEWVIDGPAPVIVENTLSAGLGHTCGLTASGTAYCWGRNDVGQVGDGSTTARSLPTPVVGGHTFASMHAGNGYTCALELDGTAWCWGSNLEGRLGDGTLTNRSTPGPVSGGHRFTSISTGGSTCALEAGGDAYCWGGNTHGQLGDGTNLHRLIPTLVSGGHSFAVISSGRSAQPSTCAVRDDGAAYCWGYNASGQLGDGSTTSRNEPVPVLGGHVFSSISVGSFHVCGLRAVDDAALCWGTNTLGQLGTGTHTDHAAPTPVAGGHAFAFLSAGAHYTCGLDLAGAAFCWGKNGNGELGDGTTDNRVEPTSVNGGHIFHAISTGSSGFGGHTCGLRADGAALCWGANSNGQIGDGTTVDRLVPTFVHGWTALP
jgi:alpha-tubulin suppressor-like RCC1 family protein